MLHTEFSGKNEKCKWCIGALVHYPGKIIENKFEKALRICRKFRTFAL